MGQAARAGEIARSVAQQSAPDVLAKIASPGCAVAIWQRSLSPAFQGWIDALAPSTLPQLRTALPPGRVAKAVGTACNCHGCPDGPERRFLSDDIAELAFRFARVMCVDTIRLRLDVVTADACRKFHLDNVPARLLCTYRGRGTEYGCFWPGGDPNPVDYLSTGCVGLFRGKLWPGSDLSGIVHRSPPIESTGETRLVLVIDTPEEE